MRFQEGDKPKPRRRAVCSNLLFHLTLLSLFLLLFPPTFSVALQPVALLTGATGRTGTLVTQQLIDQGYHVLVYCRDEAKAHQTLGYDSNNQKLTVVQGDFDSEQDVKAFQEWVSSSSWKSKLTHLVFMAGGEGADYQAVNQRGVASMAQLSLACDNLSHFIVISSAWTTRPYSIASLLFNSIYSDSVPMASHYLGEQALRRVALQRPNFHYVILRAGGLNSDENYAKKYPDAVGKGLTYQQGDNFDFLGVAGRPGMVRSQLAQAVVTAMDVEGRYTVEVTGSGTVHGNDSSVYDGFYQDDGSMVMVDAEMEEEVIVRIHTDATERLKQTAIAASFGGITLIGVFGLIKGLVLLVTMDALIILFWSRFLANQQTC